MKIEERLIVHAVVLQGGRGLFAASESVVRDEWRTYLDTVNADQTVPGFEGIGFAKLVAPKDLVAHEAYVRAEGYPDYRVRPPGPHDTYSSRSTPAPIPARPARNCLPCWRKGQD